MLFALIAKIIEAATATSPLVPSSVENVPKSIRRPIPSSSHTLSRFLLTPGTTSKLLASKWEATSASSSFYEIMEKNAILLQKNMTLQRHNITDADSVQRPWRQTLRSFLRQRVPKRWLQKLLTRPVLSLSKQIRSTKSLKRRRRLLKLPRLVLWAYGAEQKPWLQRIRVLLQPLLVMDMTRQSKLLQSMTNRPRYP